MDGSWVKIYRKLTEWEWYGDTNMVRLYLHLLLKANNADRRWRGEEVKRGQLITSLETLKAETNLSTRTLRTCLERLQQSGEIAKTATHQYTLITICKYDDYQGGARRKRQTSDKPNDKPNDKPSDKPSDKQTTNPNNPVTDCESGGCRVAESAERQTNDTQNDTQNDKQATRQTTTTKEYKNNKNNNIDDVARAREEDFIEEVFSQRSAIEAFLMSERLTEAEARAMAKAVVSEWAITGKQHRDDVDKRQHLLNQIRIKKKQRNNGQQNNQPSAGSNSTNPLARARIIKSR